MPSKIILKKSSDASKVPLPEDLDYGELAINYTDGKIYFKKANDTIDAFSSSTLAGVTSFNNLTGAITANHALDAVKAVDGSGSGLDADLLDGLDSSAFYLASNPNGYITNAALSSYLALSGGTTTGKIISGTTNGDVLEIRNDTAASSSSSSITFKNKNGIGTYRSAARISGLNNDNALDGDLLIETFSGGTAYKGLLVDENSHVWFYDTNGAKKFKWDANNVRALINDNVVLHAGNYNTYSPTLTGGGASGTWSISVTGTAFNVTGTVAIANGGTGAITAAAALTNLGAYPASNPTGYITSAALSSYLPLTGGTMTSTVQFNTDYNEQGWRFWDSGPGARSDGTYLVFDRGAGTGGDQNFYVQGFSNILKDANVVLHAANYSSYALPLTGGVLSGNIQVPRIGVGQSPDPNYPLIVAGGAYLNSGGDLYAEGRLYTRGPSGTFKEVLHPDNYSSYALPLSGGTVTGTVYLNSDAIVGNNGASVAYTNAANGKLYFGSAGSDAPSNYHIGTAMEDYGGNYSKLDFRWYTGQRFYSHYAYGGFRFKEITTGSTLFSVGETDLNVRVNNGLIVSGRSTVSNQQKFGNERKYFIGNLTTAGSATRYEIARVYIDYNDWHAAGTILVELQNTYFYGGDRQVYSISYDYNNVHCSLIESIGPRGRSSRVVCSSPIQVSGDSYYISVYADVKYYGYYDVYVTTSWPEVTTHGAHTGAILVYQSPSGLATGDFDGNDNPVSMRASSLSLNSNTVLHTGNYYDYALPLTGGSVTGQILVTAGASAANSYSGSIRVAPSTSEKWAGISFPDAVGGTSNSNNYWFYGRGASISDRALTAHIPSYSDYGSTGAIPSWGVYTTGAISLFRVWADGSVTAGGNQVLHTGNYTNYTVARVDGNSGAFNLDTVGAGKHAFFRFSQGSWAGTNPVPGNYSHVLSVNSADDNRTIQMYFGDVQGALYWRMNQGGTQHPWERILTSNNYNSYSPSLTGSGASGTWGISITGNAATITGQANSATITASSGVDGNNIVRRDVNGYIYANHINFSTTETENPTISSFITSNGDGWSRKSSLAHVKNSIRGVADGTWGINVTGTAGGETFSTVTSRGSSTTAVLSVNGFEPYGIGGNSGNTGASYRFGYQESGDWNWPYPDLIIGYHTGMKMGANTGYGGIRFYSDHPSMSSTEIFSIGNGDSNIRVANTLYVGGNVALHAGNYTDYLNGTYLRAAGQPGYGNWNDFGNNTPQSVRQIYQEHFNIGSNTGSSNFPGNRNYNYGALISLNSGDAARAQIYISHAGNDLIFRGGWYNDSWTTWNKVLTDQNYASYALPISGGTLTGTFGVSRNDVQRVLESYNASASNATQFFIEHEYGNVKLGNLRGSVNFSAGALLLAGNQVLSSGNYSSFALPLTGGTVSGAVSVTSSLTSTASYVNSSNAYFYANRTGISSGQVGIQLQTASTSKWWMYLGISDDNTLRWYNSINSADVLTLSNGGNLTATGNVTAYSDERLKKDWCDLPNNFVERLAKIKHGTYERIDTEERQAGASAQDWRDLLPEVVSVGTDEDKTLALAYGNAAVVSAIQLAKRVVEQEARIKRLESLIEKLIGE